MADAKEFKADKQENEDTLSENNDDKTIKDVKENEDTSGKSDENVDKTITDEKHENQDTLSGNGDDKTIKGVTEKDMSKNSAGNVDKTVTDEKPNEQKHSESEENKIKENTSSMKTDDEKVEESAAVKDDNAKDQPKNAESTIEVKKDNVVVYKLRDRNKMMVNAWREVFKDYTDRVEISHGDIFREGPAADAIVSPANSFGFMDGGIDMVYSMHFGWQLQQRLQEIIVNEKHGEILVGDAVVMPTFEGGAEMDSMDWSGTNDGQPIKWLISAPTMRVPMNVDETVNAYLAFRAVILAVQAHNRDESKETITSVLMPGLGTAVGRMPVNQCAYQMLQAFETFELGLHQIRKAPDELYTISSDHAVMAGLYDN